MPAITQDAALTNDYPEGLDENAFVNALMNGDPEEGDDAPVKKPSKKQAPTEDTEQDDETTEADADNSEETPEDAEDDEAGNEDDTDAEEEDKAKSKKFADETDDTYVKVKIGDEEHEVKVTDLKRLYGQEASLTRKSQEVAEERKAIETKRAENIAAYDVLLKRATERADQYRALPWTQLMKDPNVPGDQLQALQAEAQKALEDEGFLKTELGNFMQKVTQEQATAQRAAAQEALKTINNPESPAHIKGWSDALYNDIRTFGVEMGIPADTVNQLTDAGAIKILHMAMQFKRGTKNVVVTKKVNKTPTKIVKNSASSPATRGTPVQVTAKSAVAQAKKSGSQQDAANAFEALLGDDF
jgi:hypothetical protein